MNHSSLLHLVSAKRPRSDGSLLKYHSCWTMFVKPQLKWQITFIWHVDKQLYDQAIVRNQEDPNSTISTSYSHESPLVWNYPPSKVAIPIFLTCWFRSVKEIKFYPEESVHKASRNLIQINVHTSHTLIVSSVSLHVLPTHDAWY